MLYALGVFYLLMSILIIILAFAIPGLAITPALAFGLVGIVVFLTALFQLVSVAQLARAAPVPENNPDTPTP
jgi:hypothetical protein